MSDNDVLSEAEQIKLLQARVAEYESKLGRTKDILRAYRDAERDEVLAPLFAALEEVIGAV